MRPAPSPSLSLSILLVCSTAAACGGDDPDGLLVRFLSQRRIPDQADALEVIVLSADDSTEVGRRRYPLTDLDGFPATLEIVRGDTTPARVRVEGDLYLGNSLVAGGGAGHDFDAAAGGDLDVALIDVPVVRSSSSAVSADGPSLVVDRPAGAAGGDLLVAMIAHDSGTEFDVPAPAGWTFESSLTDVAPFGSHTYVFWKVAGAAEGDSYTFTPQPTYSGEMVAGMWAVSGADPGDPFDAAAAAASDEGIEACTAPSIDTTVGSTLLLYACARNNIPASFSPPPGMTEDWDRRSSVASTAMSEEGAHQGQVAAGSTGARVATGTPGDGEVGILFAIAPAPAAPSSSSSSPAPARPPSHPGVARALRMPLE